MPQDNQPKMRAARPTERLSSILQSIYEGAAQQPLGRILDAFGQTDLGGMAKSFTTPDTGMRLGTANTPFKVNMPLGKLPGKSIQLLDEAAGPLANASGESMASMEALSRMQGMKGRGEEYVVRKGGVLRKLFGPEAVDYTPRVGEEYGIMGPEGFRLLQRGNK